MRVLLTSLGRGLHEFINIDKPQEVIRLPIIKNKGFTNEEVIFVRIGTLDAVAIYVEDENIHKNYEKEWPVKSKDREEHEPEL